MRPEDPHTIRLTDYRPPDWLVETVHLDVRLNRTATRVISTLSLRPNPARPASAPLVLNGEGLTLIALRIDGIDLAADDFAIGADTLTLFQPPPGPFQLAIETEIDPSGNTQLMGLYRTSSSYCTQCEAEGFRRITYFPDRPDVMAVYTTRIEADRTDAPVLLANGNLVAAGDIAGTTRHFAEWHDPFPKPSYLFALVGGPLSCVADRFVTMSGREVALRIYVEPGKERLCGYAMDALKRSMRWDEEAFGREYDLDIFMIVAVSDFNMGAMENKGLNIFNDKYVLASAETATDQDFANIEAIIAHEYFHNWTGNRITCRDWFQLCLKEGLTVFRDQEFTSDQRSRPVKRIADVRALRTQQFVEDAGPLAHPVRPSQYSEINNFYTATVYEKGAEVVRMLRTLLGGAAFRRGMDLYFRRHDGEAATVEEFVQCFADAGAIDLSQFMLWYAQAGTPEVAVTGTYDAAAKTYSLELAQVVPPTPGQPVKQAMVIPLAPALFDPDGRKLPLVLSDGRRLGGVAVLTRPADRFVFGDIAAPPVLSINRGFSAPVKISSNAPAADLRFLAAHDTDPFNRWQALQSLAMAHLVADVAARRAGRRAPGADGLFTALAAILDDPRLEPAFLALALTPPTEADIAREIARDIDPDAVFAARLALRQAIGARLGPALSRLRARLAAASPYRPDAASAGRRALRNTCLDLIAADGGAAGIGEAARQYRSADNMTDRMAALSTLALHDHPERDGALDDFYRRFSGDALVTDKWFALQATIPEHATLDRVKGLTAHPAFSFANPNRVRSLVGSFAQANQKEFNRPDGAGYGFVADIVLAMDKRNSQVAARLATTFRSWRALEPVRRTAAEATLKQLAATPGLSRDLADIVGRSLAKA